MSVWGKLAERRPRFGALIHQTESGETGAVEQCLLDEMLACRGQGDSLLADEFGMVRNVT